jgi:hypothetical protein
LVAVGVDEGVRVGVFVAVGVTVGVNVAVGVTDGKVGVGVGNGVAERIETAPIAQDFPRMVPSVQVMVTDAAPGFVLPAPMTSSDEVPVE